MTDRSADTDSSRRGRLRVAIDGPAGAGKSTVARGLAKRLGYVLLDTGALYRAVALAARRAGIAWEDSASVGALAQQLADAAAIAIEASDSAPVSLLPPSHDAVTSAAIGGSGMRVLLRGDDVSTAIRAPEMSLGASRVSAIPAVRAALLDMQRRAGLEGGVVLEGRDIGTVVLPDAEAKFFLTASPEVRASRRMEELAARGTTMTFEAVLDEVVSRDRADTERPVAPLKQAEDAILVDSSDRPVEEIIEEMARVVEARAAAL
ncbi:MAG: (d)CMP kinase [Byssovorax sp.]